jgi:hypothetical protein
MYHQHCHRRPQPAKTHYIQYDVQGIRPRPPQPKKHQHRPHELQTDIINLTSYSAFPLSDKLRTLERVIQIYDSWLQRLEIAYARRWYTMEERTAHTDENDLRLKNYRDALRMARTDHRLVVDSGMHRLYRERLDAVEWSLEACSMVFADTTDVGLLVKLNYCLGGIPSQA